MEHAVCFLSIQKKEHSFVTWVVSSLVQFLSDLSETQLYDCTCLSLRVVYGICGDAHAVYWIP